MNIICPLAQTPAMELLQKAGIEIFDLGTTFENDPQLYQEIRPRYPEALFDALISKADLNVGARLLEIGPGTGQATVSLAARNFSIIGVELGSKLAEVARSALNQFPRVEIITGAFEDVDLPRAAFDLVYSASAFHWVDPKVRFKKTYDVLRPDGHLAVIHSNRISDGKDDAFFFATNPIYQKYLLSDSAENYRLPKAKELKGLAIDESLFSAVSFQYFPLVVRYTAANYIKLLRSYSPTIAMPADLRTGFLDDIHSLVESKFQGYVDRHYAMALTLAKKR